MFSFEPHKLVQKHVNHNLDKYSLDIEMSPTDMISLTTPNLRLLPDI